MTIFGHVARWLRGRPVWAGNRLRSRGYQGGFYQLHQPTMQIPWISVRLRYFFRCYIIYLMPSKCSRSQIVNLPKRFRAVANVMFWSVDTPEGAEASATGNMETNALGVNTYTLWWAWKARRLSPVCTYKLKREKGEAKRTRSPQCYTRNGNPRNSEAVT